MPEMTLSEAALWAGKGRPAILKAIQKGTLTANKDENGQWRIDASELSRVYPPGHSPNVSNGVSRSSQDIDEAIAAKNREIALMREALDEFRKQRDDWQGEAAKWQAQAESQTRLLTHQGQRIPQEPPRKQGWLARFREAAWRRA